MKNEIEEWPEALDAVVSAPEHHRVLFENDHVRVLDTRVLPGERVPLHTHKWPSVAYTISSGDFVRFDAEGNATLDTRTANLTVEPGSAMWLPPLEAHAIENVGATEVRAVTVEIKDR
jgi:quercetin dioxygenase-like cupin family protein